MMKRLLSQVSILAGVLLVAGFVVSFPKLLQAGAREVPQAAVPSTQTAAPPAKSQELVFPGALDIRLHPQAGQLTPPAELVLTDPEGKRLGQDPVAGKSYLEIPQAYYEREGLEDAESGEPGPESAILYLRNPSQGQYLLQVIGVSSGVYTLEVAAFDRELKCSKALVANIKIRPGLKQQYVISYSNKPGSRVEVRPIAD